MDTLIRTIGEIDISELLEFYHTTEKDISWSSFDQKGKQAGVQFLKGTDPWAGSTDRVKIYSRNFDQLNPFFVDSPFEQLIESWKLKRTRLMWLGPWSCYTFHRDDSPRIHIPLITNPNAYFLFKIGLVKHLAAGQVYWVNTREEHSAMNGSDEPRLHIVGCVENLSVAKNNKL